MEGSETTKDRSGVANGSCSPTEVDQKKHINHRRKVYTHRNSVLTDIMEVSHVQTVYNICVAVCILLFVNAVLYYLAAPQKFLEDSKVMGWACHKINWFVIIWLSLNLASASVYQAFQIWVHNRHRIPIKIADAIFHTYCLFIYILMFTVTPYVVTIQQMPPITAFSVLSEQVRIFMKIYSFVQENSGRVYKHDEAKDGEQKLLCPTFGRFMYFMFAPVLIYRDYYPRTKEVNWGFVVNNFMQLVGCVFISYCIFNRFNIDVFRNVGIKPYTLPDLALILAGCMASGSIMMFLIFYGILHAWLNAFAEMLRFGDREFYKDWWNSTSFSQYYRMWNSVVHDWLHLYIHAPMNRKGVNRWTSVMTVFVVSAIAHEYIICFSLGFFYPVLGVVYSTIGISVIFITQSRTAQWWNTFMWAMLFSGWGCIIFLYCVEWYSRQNCPRTRNDIWDYFIPRSLNCPLTAAS